MWQVWAWCEVARQGVQGRPGWDRRGQAGRGEVRSGRRGPERLGKDRRGGADMAGMDGCGPARNGRAVLERRGKERRGWV